MEPAGAVLIAVRGERAVFIRPVEVATFLELIELILARPTVAGPPLIRGPLEALAAKLSLPTAVTNIRTPIDIHLTGVDEECLTLLRHQIGLREKLPLRIQRTCVTCGNTKIQNPNMKVKTKVFENTNMLAGTALETIGLVAEGHHVRAVIKVIGGASEFADKNIEEIPACEDCQGQDFETPAVTYCPHCKKLRAETILLECPDCDASFVDPDSLDDVWVRVDQAYATFRVNANAALFSALAPKFENKLYADQRAFLIGKLTADDDLIGMCRCSRPGESLRSVALLLTTAQLIWARQLGTGSVTGGAVPWSTVSAVRTFPAGSVQIETPSGLLTFDGLKGNGIGFSGRAPTFTVPALGALFAELSGVDVMLPSGPQSAPPFAAPSSAPPVAPPPFAAPVSSGPPPLPVQSSAPPSDQPVLIPPTSPAALPAGAGSAFPEPVTWIVRDPAEFETLAPGPARSTASGRAHVPAPSQPAQSPPPQGVAPQSPPPYVAPQSAPPHVAPQTPPPYVAPQTTPPHVAPQNLAPQSAPPHVAPQSPAPGNAAQQAPTSSAYGPPGVPHIDLSSAPPPAAPASPGWYADPFGLYPYRWWDGTQWTRTFHR